MSLKRVNNGDQRDTEAKKMIKSSTFTFESEPEITPEWFMRVEKLTSPKEVKSLVWLWEEMIPKQVTMWCQNRKIENLVPYLQKFLIKSKAAVESNSEEIIQEIDQEIEKIPNWMLHGIVRVLHLKIHLEGLDNQATEIEKPRAIQTGDNILDAKLVLQSFLEYLSKNGIEQFESFLNSTLLRLVSTVHPNETERTTNLGHYSSLLEKFTDWRMSYESLQQANPNAPQYRIRREILNQIRRDMKAEIEGIWQSDQLRREQILVKSEARRILERYKVLFKAYPMVVKFIKHLASEAFWRYQANLYASKPEWLNTFKQIYHHIGGNTREDRLLSIKKTFRTLNIELKPPRIRNPVISFGTWKGGDRDGNPFVVASFTNLTFLEQKEFVLEQYIELVSSLLDKLTPCSFHVGVTEELMEEIKKDSKLFPMIEGVKPREPYRAKLRYILEKLTNTMRRVREVKLQGQTSQPLLGQTIVGPIGYNTPEELQKDINVIYNSLSINNAKSQARSHFQDLKILADTFGFHMTAIDFRQTSSKNFAALLEYLEVVSHPYAKNLPKMNEAQKQKVLIDLISSDIELEAWSISSLSKISRDTFESLIIFADAAKIDPRSTGKFIISMTQGASDILTVMFLLKLCGMLECRNGKIVHCPFDITGLFETIEDLKVAPFVFDSLMKIPLYRDYIKEQRDGNIIVMLGYSDSVRDGSALASDAQLASTCIQIRKLEDTINAQNSKQIQFIFYRGRGDTLPRGYGGSIEKAIQSQSVTSSQEHHTEQNRYLRCYSTVSSALDHLHKVYSAHLSAQLSTPLPNTEIFQKIFDFFGKISFLAWNSLVKGGKNGDPYFDILNKYSILPHLPKSHFASRPVARDNVTYNIDSIRAIPFTMVLAQMREFSSAYYGTGIAFENGISILEFSHIEDVLVKLIAESKQTPSEKVLEIIKNTSLEQLIKESKMISSEGQHAFNQKALLSQVLSLYPSVDRGIEEIAQIVLFLRGTQQRVINVLREMYQTYAPFRYSIENKEASLLIRNNRILQDYIRDATDQEKEFLKKTEEEATRTTNYILEILGQTQLRSKTMTQNFNSADLFLLHKIQSLFLRKYRMLHKQGKKPSELHDMDLHIQMTILAISEGLGFGGQ